MSSWLTMSIPHPFHSCTPIYVLVAPCVCVCINHLYSGPIPWLKCVHASVHLCMSTWLAMSTPLHLHSSRVQSCVALYAYPSHPSSGPIPWLECAQASVHVGMYTWFPSAPPHCIVVYKHVHPHVCANHASSGPTLWLECVHASGHVCMFSTHHMQLWTNMYTPVIPHVCASHLYSGLTHWLECVHTSVHLCISSRLTTCNCGQTCTPLWSPTCVFQPPVFWSYILVRMCTCISMCMYIQPTFHVCSNPFA